jgi:hypothetical protein
MIIIEDVDFKMEQVKSSPFFNLSLMVPVNEGKSSERYEMKLIGYGMTFESCLKQIVSYKLTEYERTCTVQEYLDLYKQETDSLLALLKNTKVSKDEIEEPELEE